MYAQTEKYLREKLFRAEHIDSAEKQYRYEHSLRVANIAGEIAAEEGQDALIVTLAAILHDLGKFDAEQTVEHGRVSADAARPFLETLGLSPEQVDDIHYCIAVHVDGKAGYEYAHLPEADTVSDADNIDRFGMYRIYQSLRWDDIEQMDAETAVLNYRERIVRMEQFRDSYRLSTKTANELFQRNLTLQIQFYQNLVEELSRTVHFLIEKTKYSGPDTNP